MTMDSKEIYNELIRLVSLLLEDKADEMIKVKTEGIQDSVGYAALLNEINMLRSSRNQFLLFGR